MTDYLVGDTIYGMFTTRAFATGIPTVLAGSPVVSAYENNSVTQITAGITLGVSHDSVVGMNLLTVVATGANGYEAGKDYNLVITTGTVDSVSVVGEVVWSFSLGRSAAAQDLANATDGLGAIKTDTAAILVDTATTLQGELDAIQAAVITNAAGVDIAADIIAMKAETALIVADTNELQTDDVPGLIAALNNAPAVTAASIADAVWDEAVVGHVAAGSFGATDAAILADTADLQANQGNWLTATGFATSSALTTAQNDLDIITGASGVNLLTATQASIDAIEADTNELQVDDTPGAIAALNNAPAVSAATIADAVWDEAQADHVAVGSFGITASEIAAIPTTPMRGTDNAALATSLATAQADLDTITGADGVNLLSATQASIDAIEADTNELQLDDYPTSIAAVQTAADAIKAITDLLTLANINAEVDTAFTTQMADSVGTDGTIATREQAIYTILQFLTEFGISSSTYTVYKVDGTTPLATFTLDDAVNPTAITRTT